MEQLLKLAENYMLKRVVSNHAPLTHVNKALLIGGLCAFLFGLVALVFLLMGIYLWFLETMPQYEAMMAFGGVLFVITLLLTLSLVIAMSVKRHKSKETQRQIRDEILLNLKLAEQEIKDLNLYENNPKTCLAVASLIGFILSEKAL